MVVLVLGFECFFFFFKQKTAYEMRISDWSSDVCSSDLAERRRHHAAGHPEGAREAVCDAGAAAPRLHRRPGLLPLVRRAAPHRALADGARAGAARRDAARAGALRRRAYGRLRPRPRRQSALPPPRPPPRPARNNLVT